MTANRDIELEECLSSTFLEEVAMSPGGENIRECLQCGTCSGSCPASYMMDYTPRQVFAMVRAGMRDGVLTSDAIWLCCSCYSCSVRCPNDIKVTDIMYILKRIAINEGKYKKGARASALSRSFVSVVNRYGRNHEAELLARFFMGYDWLGALKRLTLAAKLLLQGRLPFLPRRIKDLNGLRAIMNRAQATKGA